MHGWWWSLAAYALQVALVIAAGALAAAATRVRRPRVMLAYWQCLLLVALLLPAVRPRRIADGPAVIASVSAEWAAVASAAGSGFDWPAVLAAVLLAGVALRGWALGRGLHRLIGLRRRAMPWSAPERLADAQRQVGGQARLLLSAEVQVPATFGLRRGTILLPAGFAALPTEQQHHVLCHELVHVRRHDWAWALGEEAVRAVLWFHPVVAWLVDRIRLAREQVVDGEVVCATRARQAYLETLLAMARVGAAGPAPAPLALFLKESHLMKRVDSLLEEVTMSTKRVVVAVAASAALVLVTGLAAAWALPLSAAEVNATAPGPVAGGVPGGIEGGVPGGVEGSVPGGVAGGVAGDTKEARQNAPERKVVYKVPPVYPPELKEQGVEGIVQLEVKVEAAGEVSSVRPLSGHAGLAEAASAAVRQWRYAPHEKGATLMTITVRFTLAKDKAKDKAKDEAKESRAVAPAEEAKDPPQTGPRRKLLHRFAPAFPIGITLHSEMVVELAVTVEASGEVSSVKVVKGDSPPVVEACIAAARQWRWEPSDGPTVVPTRFTFVSPAIQQQASQAR